LPIDDDRINQNCELQTDDSRLQPENLLAAFEYENDRRQTGRCREQDIADTDALISGMRSGKTDNA
jgi:hypothetical protein